MTARRTEQHIFAATHAFFGKTEQTLRNVRFGAELVVAEMPDIFGVAPIHGAVFGIGHGPIERVRGNGVVGVDVGEEVLPTRMRRDLERLFSRWLHAGRRCRRRRRQELATQWEVIQIHTR